MADFPFTPLSTKDHKAALAKKLLSELTERYAVLSHPDTLKLVRKILILVGRSPQHADICRTAAKFLSYKHPYRSPFRLKDSRRPETYKLLYYTKDPISIQYLAWASACELQDLLREARSFTVHNIHKLEGNTWKRTRIKSAPHEKASRLIPIVELVMRKVRKHNPDDSAFIELLERMRQELMVIYYSFLSEQLSDPDELWWL